ncbi:secreted RxLR effector protein 161-like [Curcuma longa]|uniref:secreted RxLR effector protein 161-like n=1 Tax=Curcuma longa TaxID=136217 RepID=UPI003D9E785A
MENAKNISTPIGTNAKQDKDEEGKEVDSKTYRSMIGSLLYLTASRPDILFAVGMCARYQSCAKESHLTIVKRILRYIKGTLNVGLWYPRNQNFDLIGYTDSDYAGCKLDRKSTSGGCQFLGSSLVSWSSRKQPGVALSTTEAEYVALGGCVAQLLWMMHTLKDYELNYTNVKVLCDNMTIRRRESFEGFSKEHVAHRSHEQLNRSKRSHGIQFLPAENALHSVCLGRRGFFRVILGAGSKRNTPETSIKLQRDQ